MVQYCRSHVRHVLFIVYMRSSYNMVQYCRSDVRHVLYIVYMRSNMVLKVISHVIIPEVTRSLVKDCTECITVTTDLFSNE